MRADCRCRDACRQHVQQQHLHPALCCRGCCCLLHQTMLLSCAPSRPPSCGCCVTSTWTWRRTDTRCVGGVCVWHSCCSRQSLLTEGSEPVWHSAQSVCCSSRTSRPGHDPAAGVLLINLCCAPALPPRCRPGSTWRQRCHQRQVWGLQWRPRTRWGQLSSCSVWCHQCAAQCRSGTC